MNASTRRDCNPSRPDSRTRGIPACQHRIIEAATATLLSIPGTRGCLVADIDSKGRARIDPARSPIDLTRAQVANLLSFIRMLPAASPPILRVQSERLPKCLRDLGGKLGTVQPLPREFGEAVRLSVGLGQHALCFVVTTESGAALDQIESQVRSVGELVQLALTGAGEQSGSELPPLEYRMNLTRRQQSVASLVSTGCTNAEVAQKMGISLSTVKCHLNEIYARIGVTNRAGLVAAIYQTIQASSDLKFTLDETIRHSDTLGGQR